MVSNNNAEEVGGGVKRVGRGSEKKSRPHSWHSTLQRGLARARSRSSGRQDKEARDKQKRASSALDKGELWQEREESDQIVVTSLKLLSSLFFYRDDHYLPENRLTETTSWKVVK